MAAAALTLAVCARLGAAEWGVDDCEEAQVLAEKVAAAAWNENKTTGLEPSVVRLQMTITRLLDQTTGISGGSSVVAAHRASLDERLRRLGAEVSETEVLIRLPGAILFDFDAAVLRPDAERTLAELAAVIKTSPGTRVRVEGHTDSIADEGYNLDLSERRAQAVRDDLVKRGVDADRLVTVGHGEARPVADNETAAGRQRNRRVEVIIENAD
jgi:outer membrane protein OmpA-like peptidoglycan-associated protein